MDQLRDNADGYLLVGCIYCGGNTDTRDHVPSRVLLDRPFPENLPLVKACLACNNGFSSDEEYLACLVECSLAGSTDPAKLQRNRITRILEHSPALRARLEAACAVVDGVVTFTADDKRVENVIRKLARGHVAFEQSIPVRSEPTELFWWPMHAMTADQRDNFNDFHFAELTPEYGSRASQRLQVLEMTLRSVSEDATRVVGMIVNDWVEVQPGNYRYLAMADRSGVRVRIVIREFLAAHVSWDDALDPSSANSTENQPEVAASLAPEK